MTNEQPDESLCSAWLEKDGDRIPLPNSFNFGRSSKCNFTIQDTQVSRVHTLVQFHLTEHSWKIVDLGSTNGTYLNGVKILKQETLKNGDQIQIGGSTFQFYTENEAKALDESLSFAGETILAIEKGVRCWFLLADVVGSTRLSRTLPQELLTQKMHQWVKECERIIEAHGGLINELLGDGLLAFWRFDDVPIQKFVELMGAFNSHQSETGMDYRIVCHLGEVQVGGGVSSGREKLAGSELNCVFKMEKVAAMIGHKITLSQPAASEIQSHLELKSLGEFEVPGFHEKFPLYAV